MRNEQDFTIQKVLALHGGVPVTPRATSHRLRHRPSGTTREVARVPVPDKAAALCHTLGTLTAIAAVPEFAGKLAPGAVAAGEAGVGITGSDVEAEDQADTTEEFGRDDEVGERPEETEAVEVARRADRGEDEKLQASMGKDADAHRPPQKWSRRSRLW